LFEVGDDLGGEVLLRGHLDVFFVTQRLDEKALGGVAGNDGGAAVAACHQASAVVDVKASLDLGGLGRMTFITLVDEDRPDLRFKKLNPLPGRSSLGRLGDNAFRAGADQPEHHHRPQVQKTSHASTPLGVSEPRNSCLNGV
jgi:hypothetical protein